MTSLIIPRGELIFLYTPLVELILETEPQIRGATHIEFSSISPLAIRGFHAIAYCENNRKIIIIV